MSEYRANAMTINCFADLEARRFIPPCIALARLMDQGVPAGCEGDLNTLLTMMLFAFTSGEPSIMGNIYLFRPPERGRPIPPPRDVVLEDTKMYLKDNRARFTHDVKSISEPEQTFHRIFNFPQVVASLLSGSTALPFANPLELISLISFSLKSAEFNTTTSSTIHSDGTHTASSVAIHICCSSPEIVNPGADTDPSNSPSIQVSAFSPL